MASSTLDPSTTFPVLCDTAGIDARLKKAIARLGHVHPTLVQAKCIPLALQQGRDLLVRARTGSGKTLAYSLPILQKLLKRKQHGVVGAVILVPTRELCTQVASVLQALCYYVDEIISIASLTVGQGRGEKQKQETIRQEAMLRDRPSAIVATPAGLLAHIRSGTVDLTHVESLVVDEADLVLSFGYSNDIAQIVKALPRICQGFLMSATLSPELDALKSIMLNKPIVLKLEQDDTDRVGNLKQFYTTLPRRDKNLVIFVFLKLGLLKGKGLFFVNSIDSGYRLKLFLEQFHIRSAVLNAELPFYSRINIIEQFNVGNFDYLIATDGCADTGTNTGGSDDCDDVDSQIDSTKERQKRRKRDAEFGVSRGVDFRNVSFVLNVDFPPNPRSYAHRVGRTARGGANGVALSIVDADNAEEHKVLLAVQESQPSIPLDVMACDRLQLAAQELHLDSSHSGVTEQVQPMPLDFDLREIEGFRYRVEDVQRAVTKTAVQEARAAELRSEILNSERLQSHFEENPADLQLLRHDKASTHPARLHDHLKHVPKYLLPKGMQVASLNKKRKRKKIRVATEGMKRSDNDPLQGFDGNVDLNRVKGDGGGDNGDDPFAEFMDEGGDCGPDNKRQKMDRLYNNTRDGTGRSTSGRNAWKEKHKKGAFSGKKRLSEKKYKKPLGI